MTLKLDQALQILRNPDCPRVITTGEIGQWFAMAGSTPAEATLKRWIARLREGGLIKPVRRGLYLNALAIPAVQPDEAAGAICRGAIVSLQKVLGDAGILNNFTSWVTCVVALPPVQLKSGTPAYGFTRPSTGKVETQSGLFTFQAIPFDLIHPAGLLEDCLEQLPYQRATPEKAFLDWLYLGSTPRSHMTLPPMDMEVERLDQNRLLRLADAMGLRDTWAQWRSQKAAFDMAPGTLLNAPPTDH